jgi:hypothetical protein
MNGVAAVTRTAAGAAALLLPLCCLSTTITHTDLLLPLCCSRFTAAALLLTNGYE